MSYKIYIYVSDTKFTLKTNFKLIRKAYAKNKLPKYSIPDDNDIL